MPHAPSHLGAVLLLLAGLSAGALAGDAAGRQLVEQGVARCIIVADAGISPSEKTAVAQLRKYLKAMSGAEILLADAAAPAAGPSVTQLVVGHATVKRLHPEIDLASLGTDGFILKSLGAELLIAGGEKRGTLYAANALLAKLGVRWWAVGATTVPTLATIAIPALDERQVPGLEYRDMLYGDGGWIDGEDHRGFWNVRNRINGFNYSTNPENLGGRVNFEANLVHSYARLLQPVDGLDGTFAKHPELWALINGKRQGSQPCLSEPQVFTIMLANVRKQLREHPEYAFVVVGQEDNKSYCRCPACAALAEAEGSQAGPGIAFVNRIAEVVEQEFPGKWVMAPAYEWSRQPPKNLKPRRNVGITLCSIECDFSRPLAEQSTPANKAFAEDIIGWSKIAAKLYIWDYTTNFTHYLLPHPNLDALVPNVQFLAQHKVQGILNQGSHSTRGGEFAQLRMWVLAQAMWDPPRADGKALIGEFLAGYYGAAAPHLQAYIDAMHAPGRADPGMAAGCYARLNAAWLTPAAVAAGEAALQQAERAVADDPVLAKRVRHAHMPLWYVLLKRGPQSRTWAAVTAKVGPLDITAIAKGFATAVTEQETGQIAEGEPVKPFVAWAQAYAEQAARAVPLPPELKDADPASYRLIQASQLDSRGRWWVGGQEGASDGWVVEIPTVAWTVTYNPNLLEDVTAGKTYKLFMRVKASAAKPSGTAFAAGIHGKGKSPSRKVAAADLADGAYHALEIAEFTAGPDMGSIWIALSDGTAPKVLLDCLWFQEVQK